MELLNLIDPQQFVVQIICFLILVFTLRKVLWNKFLGALDQRKERIASEFKQIDNQKDELNSLKNNYAEKLNQIEALMQARIQEAVEEGRKQHEAILKKANQDAQLIIESARKNVQYEVSKATTEVRGQIVDLAIAAAAKVLEERMTEMEDRKLIDGFLNELEKINGR